MSIFCHDLHQKLCEDCILGAMTAQEAGVGIAAGEEGRLKLIPVEACGIHGGETDPIGIETSILLAGEVGCLLGTKALEF